MLDIMGYGFPVAFYCLCMNSCKDHCAQGKVITAPELCVSTQLRQKTREVLTMVGRLNGHVVNTAERSWPGPESNNLSIFPAQDPSTTAARSPAALSA